MLQHLGEPQFSTPENQGLEDDSFPFCGRAYFLGASRSFQGVYHCQNICQCQWIFLMKPRLFRLGTFWYIWPHCRWIHLLSIPMVNSPVYWLQMIEMNMRPTSCVFHHVPWDSETFKLRILTGKLFPEMPIIKDGHCLYRSDFSCNVPWRWVRRHQWWTLLQGGRDDVSIGIYVSHHQEVKIHLWFIYAYLWISLFSLVDQEEKGISFNVFHVHFFSIFT